MDLTLTEAEYLPETINVSEIAEDAMTAAFALIAARLDLATGETTTGDFSPDEDSALTRVFEMFVRSMAANNPACGPAAEEAQTAAWFDKVRAGDQEAVEEAIHLIRVHALPEEHPLALN